MQFRLDYGITTLLLLSIPRNERLKKLEQINQKIKRWFNKVYQEALDILENPDYKIKTESDYSIFVMRKSSAKLLVNYYWYKTLPAILLLRYYHAVKSVLQYYSSESVANIFSFIIAIDPGGDYYNPLKYLEYPEDVLNVLQQYNYGLFFELFMGVTHPEAHMITARYFKEINDILELPYEVYNEIFHKLYEKRAIFQKYKANAIDYFYNEEKFLNEYRQDIKEICRTIYQTLSQHLILGG